MTPTHKQMKTPDGNFHPEFSIMQSERYYNYIYLMIYSQYVIG